MARPRMELDENWILEQYLSGRSLTEIAADLEVSRDPVKRVVDDAGVYTDQRGQHWQEKRLLRASRRFLLEHHRMRGAQLRLQMLKDEIAREEDDIREAEIALEAATVTLNRRLEENAHLDTA